MFKFFRRFASPRTLDPYQQALRALETGDAAGADAQLTALLEAGNVADRASAFNKRGVARMRQSLREAAEADFQAALDERPHFAPALTNLGNLFLERGDVEEAVRYYERAIVSDDSYALAHFNLGVAYRRLGRIDDSVRALRRSERLEGRFRITPSKRA